MQQCSCPEEGAGSASHSRIIACILWHQDHGQKPLSLGFRRAIDSLEEGGGEGGGCQIKAFSSRTDSGLLAKQPRRYFKGSIIILCALNWSVLHCDGRNTSKLLPLICCKSCARFIACIDI